MKVSSNILANDGEWAKHRNKRQKRHGWKKGRQQAKRELRNY